MKRKLAFFNGRAFFWGIGLSYIYRLNGTAFWISSILGMILGFILLLLYKKKNENKIIKMITNFILATMACTLFVHLGHTVYLKNTPVWLLALSTILCALIASKSKENPWIKVINIIFVTSISMFLFKIISLYPQAKIENFMPLYDLKTSKIIWGAIVVAFVGITPILCLNDINNKKEIILNYSTAILTVFITSIIIMAVLGVKGAILYRFPEYVVLKRIDMLDFISNIDNILNISLATDYTLTIAGGFRNMNVKNKYINIALPILMLILVIILAQKSTTILLIFKYFPIVMIILFFMTLIPKNIGIFSKKNRILLVGEKNELDSNCSRKN